MLLQRNTLIRRILVQLGEAGYYVRQPTLGSKFLEVCSPYEDVSMTAVENALDETVNAQVTIMAVSKLSSQPFRTVRIAWDQEAQ